ncbi:MAG TPA: MFS transporter, partial [Hyphomicrobium sp.]|nr:MFS transporter [Hyphomicrobium sp.]
MSANAHGGRSRKINPWLIAFIVSIATFMEVLDVSIANVALRHIAGSVGASYDEATWVLTSYLIANAVILPASAWLSSMLGRKRFYMFCVALFTCASFLCGVAWSLET